MIRFVDLRGQTIGSRFVFFDTVPDRFVEIDDFHLLTDGGINKRG